LILDSSLAYEEESWEELIDGKIVAMSPPPSFGHNLTASNIYDIFRSYLKKTGKKCMPINDGTALYLTGKDYFIPDFMLVCDRTKIDHEGVHGAPDLVAEVLSPSTADRDRKYKKDLYARCGAREYWLVSPGDQALEQYLLVDGQLNLHKTYTVYPKWMLEKMTEEQRAAVPTHFKCSLFDDLDISLADIFEHVKEFIGK